MLDNILQKRAAQQHAEEAYVQDQLQKHAATENLLMQGYTADMIKNAGMYPEMQKEAIINWLGKVTGGIANKFKNWGKLLGGDKAVARAGVAKGVTKKFDNVLADAGFADDAGKVFTSGKGLKGDDLVSYNKIISDRTKELGDIGEDAIQNQIRGTRVGTGLAAAGAVGAGIYGLSGNDSGNNMRGNYNSRGGNPYGGGGYKRSALEEAYLQGMLQKQAEQSPETLELENAYNLGKQAAMEDALLGGRSL